MGIGTGESTDMLKGKEMFAKGDKVAANVIGPIFATHNAQPPGITELLMLAELNRPLCLPQ
jgi:hypothetical protein